MHAAVKKNNWKNIVFFLSTSLVAVVGTPWYLCRYDLSAADIGLFAFYMLATGLSITAGYHRLFAHATYKAHELVKILFLFFGAAAFEESALRWSAQHRLHHRYVDTDQDPYSIRKGFFYAHMGWILFWDHDVPLEQATDLSKNRWVVSQHRYYLLWAIVAGVLTPVALGALWGHALAAFIFAVCLRLTLVYHATFFINSICHMFGKATYDKHSTAKDHWLIAFLTYGEGYHNFHHRFPSDYRNGVRWYQWDPSKWSIYVLSLLQMAWDLKRVPDESILRAKQGV